MATRRAHPSMLEPWVKARVTFILTHPTYLASTDAEQALFWHLEGLAILNLTEFLDAGYDPENLGSMRKRKPSLIAKALDRMAARPDPLIGTCPDPGSDRGRIRVFGVRLWHPVLPWRDERLEYQAWCRAHPDGPRRTSDGIDWGEGPAAAASRRSTGSARSDPASTRSDPGPKSGNPYARAPEDVDVPPPGEHTKTPPLPPPGAVRGAVDGPRPASAHGGNAASNDHGALSSGRQEGHDHGNGHDVSERRSPEEALLLDIGRTWPMKGRADLAARADCRRRLASDPVGCLAHALDLNRSAGVVWRWRCLAARLRGEGRKLPDARWEALRAEVKTLVAARDGSGPRGGTGRLSEALAGRLARPGAGA